MTEVKEVKARAPLTSARFCLREHVVQEWMVTCEPGTTVEDVCDPGYWAFVSASLRQFDRICVSCEDGSWYAELLVVYPTRVSAKVEVIFQKSFAPQAANVADGWDIKFRGPLKKWSVVDKATSRVLQDGFATEAEAMSHLANHLAK